MSTPTDFTALRLQHLDWLLARNYSPRTIADRSHWLRHFTDWLAVHSITTPEGQANRVRPWGLGSK